MNINPNRTLPNPTKPHHTKPNPTIPYQTLPDLTKPYPTQPHHLNIKNKGKNKIKMFPLLFSEHS